jgi:membrane protease YdiL (CAAX protease family)
VSPHDGRSLGHRLFANPAEGRLRGGWRLLIALGALVVASIGAGQVIRLLQLPTPFASVGGSAFGLSLFLINTVLTAVLLALAWGVDRRTLSDLGLGGERWRGNLAVGLGLGLLMPTVVFVLELGLGLVTVTGILQTRPTPGAGQVLDPILLLGLTFLFFVVVGVFEELLVRGYLLTNIAESLDGLGPVGPRTAIASGAVLTSALFGLLHLGNPNATAISAFNIAVVGLFFAGAYVATDDLGIPIGVHITWNFAVSSVYGFPVSGLRTPVTLIESRQTGSVLVTGGSFGPEAGLVVYAALLVAVGVTWWWVDRSQGQVRFLTGIATPTLRGGGSPRDTGTGNHEG